MDQLARAIQDTVNTLVTEQFGVLARQLLDDLVSADQGERLHRLRSAAERLDMSETTVRRHITEGRLRTVSVPGRVAGSTELRIRQADLDDFILSLAGQSGRQSNPQRRRAGSPRKRASSRQPSSLQELVDERLKRAGNGPAGTVTRQKRTRDQLHLSAGQ